MAGHEFEFVVYQDRTTDVVLDVYDDDKQAVLESGDVVKFVIGRRNGQEADLYISTTASSNGSVVTVLKENPGIVRVRFAQDDVASLVPGTYRGVLWFEDDSETAPEDASKVSGIGIVHVIGGLDRTPST